MIKVGTDFSGIGSPEAALKRLGLPHHNIFACDIDKYAKKSYLANNDTNVFYDDITTRDFNEVPQLDLYVAGFPCQSFSMAGKRGGFEDTRGTLFFNVAEFIKENQPKCFILENVKGLLSHDSGKTYQTITDVLTNGGGTLNGQIGMDSIENGLGYHVYTQVLNTKDYGIPQNRERIFIVGFKHWREFRFPKPFKLELKLKDVLEDNVNEKYYLSDKMIEGFKKGSWGHNYKPKEGNSIANCLDTKEGNRRTNNYISDSLYPRSSSTGKGGSGHLSKSDGTSYCVDTGCNQAIEIKGAAIRKRGDEQKLEIREDGLANSLTTIQTDSIIKPVQIGQSNKTYAYKSGTMIGKENQSAFTIRAVNPNGVKIDKRIRRLTPLECWRLQGFTDEQFYKAQKLNSDTQLYKQAGNSMTVNVMTEILKKIYLK
tara:strand:- start:2 stop:1282 length:1281 start_codon:yes stop_codon:yes gene_type:complete